MKSCRKSIYIPKELLDKMEGIPKANWSKIAQDAFTSYLKKQEELDKHTLSLEKEYGPIIKV